MLFCLTYSLYLDKKIPAAMGLIPMFLKLFGCNTVVLLHNILEQVDLESAVLPRTSWFKKFTT
jgi:hypothetical protein